MRIFQSERGGPAVTRFFACLPGTALLTTLLVGVSWVGAIVPGTPPRLRAGENCDENAEMTLGTASGKAEDQVQIELRGRSLCLVEGFSLAIGYDETQVVVVDATAGQFLTDHAGDGLLFNFANNNREDRVGRNRRRQCLPEVVGVED